METWWKLQPLWVQACKAMRSALSMCAEVLLHSPQSQSHFLTQVPLCCLFWRAHHWLCWKLMIWENFCCFFPTVVTYCFSAERGTDWQGGCPHSMGSWIILSWKSHWDWVSSYERASIALSVLSWRVMSCSLGSLILRHLHQVCKTKQVSISAVIAILKPLPHTAPALPLKHFCNSLPF